MNRVWLRFLLILLPVMTLVVVVSSKLLEQQEHEWLTNDLSRRSALISESINDYLAEEIGAGRIGAVKRLLNRISRDERLTGALVCDTGGKLIARSESVPQSISCPAPEGHENSVASKFVSVDGLTLYKAVFPVTDDGTVVGSLLVLHDTSYMGRRHLKTERDLLILLSSLALVFFFITLAVYRWSLTFSLQKFQKAFTEILTGESKNVETTLSRGGFSPLAHDIAKVLSQLRQSKRPFSPAAPASAWNAERLRAEVQSSFGDSQLCVIANREPYIHVRKGNQVQVVFPASGLVTAVEPIVKACSGLWIAHGSGSADRAFADKEGKLLVPPERPEYVLKRVWLSKAEEEGYYYGFSNEGLWPLCHIAHTRPTFNPEDWETYKTVNRKFAKAFLDEKTGDHPIVLVQDYHFALVPQMIREKNPNVFSSLFWHIPWPNPEAFGICPWKKELLEGMLSADLLGFHTQFHCNNFLDTVDRFLEARVDREHFSVNIQGHVCFVKPFPISIEWPSPHDIPREQFETERSTLLSELDLPQNVSIGVGVDRIDYTKGILERLRSVERLLDLHPELVGQFTFIQIGAPSRTHIKTYQNLNSEVQELADRINWKFHKSEVPPVLLRLAHHSAAELARFYRAADVCFVSSLHDGMNLVAKEFVAARADLGGTLVLSSFTGASKELTDALIVNPYDINESAGALYGALTMPEEEVMRRMERLRVAVADRNVYAWAGAFLGETHRIISSRRGAGPGKLAGNS